MARRTAARSRAFAIASVLLRMPARPAMPRSRRPAKYQIDQINRLVDVLKRHARVRYELPLDDLVDVRCPSSATQPAKKFVRPPTAFSGTLWSSRSGRSSPAVATRVSTSTSPARWSATIALRLRRSKPQAHPSYHGMAALRSVGTAPDRLALHLQDLLGSGVVRTLAAVAEHSEDNLRHICLETLAELAVFDIRLLIQAGGLRTTLQALTEGATEFSPTLVQVFIYLIDSLGTRHHLRRPSTSRLLCPASQRLPCRNRLPTMRCCDALLRSLPCCFARGPVSSTCAWTISVPSSRLYKRCESTQSKSKVSSSICCTISSTFGVRLGASTQQASARAAAKGRQLAQDGYRDIGACQGYCAFRRARRPTTQQAQPCRPLSGAPPRDLLRVRPCGCSHRCDRTRPYHGSKGDHAHGRAASGLKTGSSAVHGRQHHSLPRLFSLAPTSNSRRATKGKQLPARCLDRQRQSSSRTPRSHLRAAALSGTVQRLPPAIGPNSTEESMRPRSETGREDQDAPWACRSTKFNSVT